MGQGIGRWSPPDACLWTTAPTADICYERVINSDDREGLKRSNTWTSGMGGTFTLGSFRGDSSLSGRPPDTASLNSIQLPDDESKWRYSKLNYIGMW